MVVMCDCNEGFFNPRHRNMCRKCESRQEESPDPVVEDGKYLRMLLEFDVPMSVVVQEAKARKTPPEAIFPNWPKSGVKKWLANLLWKLIQ